MFDIYIRADLCIYEHDWSEWLSLSTILVRTCNRCDELEEYQIPAFLYGFTN